MVHSCRRSVLLLRLAFSLSVLPELASCLRVRRRLSTGSPLSTMSSSGAVCGASDTPGTSNRGTSSSSGKTSTSGSAASAATTRPIPLVDLSFLPLLPPQTAPGDTTDNVSVASAPSKPLFPQSVVEQWDLAFRTHGFAYIRVPKSLAVVYKELAGESSTKSHPSAPPEADSDSHPDAHPESLPEFFRQSLEKKMEFCLNQGYGRGGYVPRGVETVAKSTGDGEEVSTSSGGSSGGDGVSGGDGASDAFPKRGRKQPDPVETLSVPAWNAVENSDENSAENSGERNNAATHTVPTTPFPKGRLLTLTRSLTQQLDVLLLHVMRLSAQALRLEEGIKQVGKGGENDDGGENNGGEVTAETSGEPSGETPGETTTKAFNADYFEPSHGGGRAVNILRCAWYDVEGAAAKSDETQLLYGEHTDYTGFTFLWRSADNGLQCYDNVNVGPGNGATDGTSNGDTKSESKNGDEKNGDEKFSNCKRAWIDVPLLKSEDGENDILVVNAGDLIERWSNGYWKSDLHRVVGPRTKSKRGGQESGDNAGEGEEREGELLPKELLSIVYFTGPADETVIRTLPSPLFGAAEPGSKFYGEITAGEHLWEKISRTNK